MDYEYETDRWPFIAAKHFTKVAKKRGIRLIVLHSMEAPEKGDTAENVAKYFQSTTRQASAHICVDNNSIVQCVWDNDIAWAAPGANSDGIHIEMAGYANQSRENWLDAYSALTLDNAASAAAQYCLKYDIPVIRLSNEALGGKLAKGLVSHAQVTEVFKKGDHTDPGNGFPWDYFMDRVQHHYSRKKQAGNNHA